MRGHHFHFLIFVTALLVFAPFSLCSCSGSEPETNAGGQGGALPDDLRVGLQYFPGSSEGPGVLRINPFFMSSDPETLSSGASFSWERRPDRFTFELLSENAPAPIDQGVYLVSAPDDKKSGLGLPDQYVWVFRLDASGKPAPGTRVRALFHPGGQSRASNIVIVPDIPKDQEVFLSLQRQARVAALLGDGEQLLRYSQLLIQERPDGFAGYWFQSLALEKNGKTEEALRAAVSALERLPDPDRPTTVPGGRGHLDASGEIYRHIRRLQDSTVERRR